MDRLALVGSWIAASAPALASLRALHNVAIAQAEYYYDDEEDREEWMWNVKWRARMRRFSVGGGGGGICGSAPALCGAMSDAVIH